MEQNWWYSIFDHFNLIKDSLKLHLVLIFDWVKESVSFKTRFTINPKSHSINYRVKEQVLFKTLFTINPKINTNSIPIKYHLIGTLH